MEEPKSSDSPQNESTPTNVNSGAGPNPDPETPSESPSQASAATPLQNSSPVQEPTPTQSASVPESSVPAKKKFAFSMPVIPTWVAVTIVAVLILGALAYRYKAIFIAATVNGSPISRLSVLAQAEKEAGARVLDFMITKKLIADEAKKKNITIAQGEIDGEIKKIEDQLSKEGGTMKDFYKEQGISEHQLRSDIELQKQLEKLMADKLTVTDEEIEAYIKAKNMTLTKDQDVAVEKAKIKDLLRRQKFSTEAQTYVTNLRSQAKINLWVTY